ncbi:MAG: aminotransferase class IV [Armatimonadota bacterium]
MGLGPGAEYDETVLKARFALRIVPAFTLFETLLLSPAGTWLFEEEHLQRLSRSAQYWDFTCETEGIRARLREFTRSARAPVVVRLDLTREGEVRLSARELPEPRAEPLRLLVSARQTDPSDRLLFHKTSLRALYDRERERAVAAGFDEVIFVNAKGHLTEGAITNLFVRHGDRWSTPPIGDGLLPGIWRAQFATEVGAAERSLSLQDLAGADEVVVGNSVRGTLPVGAIHAPGGELLVSFGRRGNAHRSSAR